MSDPLFEVVETRDLAIDGPALPDGRALLSPFVWRDGAGFALLLRAVPPDGRPSGRIWFGRSDDGLRFRLDDAAFLGPDASGPDAGGCEDPTMVHHEGMAHVFYTGVDADGRGELLYASGPDLRSLAKRGVAFSCSRTEHNTKEATVDVHDGRWRLFHEYARGGRSLIGLASGASPAGPWTEHPDAIERRPGLWDGDHLSTGPLIPWGADQLLMFYNGATDGPRWSIGWATFDRATLALRARCAEPLIAPPLAADGSAILFAASALAEDDCISLYYSRDDQVPCRATLRRR